MFFHCFDNSKLFWPNISAVIIEKWELVTEKTGTAFERWLWKIFIFMMSAPWMNYHSHACRFYFSLSRSWQRQYTRETSNEMRFFSLQILAGKIVFGSIVHHFRWMLSSHKIETCILFKQRSHRITWIAQFV